MSGTPRICQTWASREAPSPELRALIGCARVYLGLADESELMAALRDCVDVERLCATATVQGMLGILHQTVIGRTAGSAETAVLKDHLSGWQHAAAQRALRLTGHLVRVMETLGTAGVQVMPLKGPAWAERLYGDITLRTWTDLDLLLVHRQVSKAREVLLAEGFVDADRFNELLLARQKGGWGQIAMSIPDQGVHLECHWEVTVGLSARSLRPESVLSRAGHLELLGRQVLTPSDVDLLLMTCLNGARDRWNSVERMLGLAVQLCNIEPDGWQTVLDAARTVKCVRRVTTAVVHVCRVFDMSVPAPVAEVATGDAMGRALLRSLELAILDHRPDRAGDHLRLLLWRFATEDSLGAGLGHAALRFLRPGPEDWQAISLPVGTRWLYYLLRPVRLVAKWFGRLVRGTRGSMLGL